MSSTSQDLAAALQRQAVRKVAAAPAARGADWRMATVTAVDPAGTVTADGIVCRRLETYTAPAVGDLIIISQSGAGSWIALGRTASAAAALGVPTHVHKPAATDRTSTTTMAADPHLSLPLGAGVWLVEAHLFVGGAAGLMVTQWAVPPGATGLKGAQGPASTVAGDSAPQNAGDSVLGRFGSHGFATSVTYGRRNVFSNLLYAVETGTLTVTTPGTCAIAWAQSTSSTTATRMGQGSWMRATRIG
ncbi:hypothetical protein AAG656_28870 [Streptomyces albidoflavus]|uniref:hypothetical protein n=1 Tax=Streptomyces albidoflavus TaxID=1886 RepID=UPI00315ADDAD